MRKLDFGVFDCDNHIYEPPDAVTRYLPKDMLDRAITPITLANGEQGLLAGGRLVTGLDHPIDKAHRPGALKEMLRQMKSGKPTEGYALEDLRPEYLEREPRLRLMDQQGIESAILYPATMGTMAENYVRGIKPLYANAHAYNQFLDETWGFNYQERIYTPALLSLRDLDSAVAELDFVLARGAKFIMLNAGPAYGRSPADAYFDPFWSRINEAKASVAYHIGEFWYNETVAPAWGLDPERSSSRCRPGSGSTAGGAVRSRKRCRRSSSTTSSAGSPTSTSWCRSSAPSGCRCSSDRWTRAAAWDGAARGRGAS